MAPGWVIDLKNMDFGGTGCQATDCKDFSFASRATGLFLHRKISGVLFYTDN